MIRKINRLKFPQFSYPEKKFYALSKALICEDMKLTTLMDVYNCINGGGEEIILSEDTRLKAKAAIGAMLSYGG